MQKFIEKNPPPLVWDHPNYRGQNPAILNLIWDDLGTNLKVIVTFRRACKKSGVGVLWKFTLRHLQNLNGPKLFWSIVNSQLHDIRLISGIFGGLKGPKNRAIGPNFPCHTYVTICITKAKGILEWQRSSYQDFFSSAGISLRWT
jgi:hypothetical protein